MTLHVYAEVEQRSDEWRALRCGIVTASVVGRLITPGRLQVADNDHSRGIVAGLVAERITGHVDETPTTPAMWRGIEEEPLARDAYAEHHAPVIEVGFMVLEDDETGHRLGYSPDGLVGDNGCIEIKSRNQKVQLQTILADEVPAANVAQLQAGLLVSGREWCDYVSFSGGMPLYVKRVTPDPKWHDAIRAAVEAYEATAAQIVADYTTKTAGLPMTERAPDFAGVELKL